MHDRVRLGRKLGSGGYGDVFEATLDGSGIGCAVKVLLTLQEEEIRRFAREVRLQTLLEHKHIVPILAHDTSARPPWLAMPLASSNLRHYLETVRGEDALWAFDQILEAVQFAHDNGVIHRDLKPDNVLIYDDETVGGYVALGDFGLGRRAVRDTTPLTYSNQPLGTWIYMAPEQVVDAANADVRADVYALGKILYEILSGELPWPQPNLSKVPPKFRYIISKCIEFDMQKRYQSVADLRSALRMIAQGSRLLTPASEAVRQEVESILADGDLSPQRLEPLIRSLLENVDDDAVMTRVLPYIEDPIIESLTVGFPSEIFALVEEFDKTVDDGLPFDYCDVVANFYRRIYVATTDLNLKVLVLRRLATMGYSHNRFYVGKMFAELAKSATDESLILAVREILVANPPAAEWLANYLRQHTLPRGIRDALPPKDAD